MNTHALIDSWCDWMEAGGLSPGTRRLRRNHLECFARHVPLECATEGDITAQLKAMRGHAPESRRSFLSSLRGFYRWAVTRGYIAHDPTAGMRPIRVPQGVPKPIPEKALRAALDRADDETRLMLMLGGFAGLRLSEIAAVHSRDVDGIWLRVRGKGGKVRRIPMHPTLAAALTDLDGWAFPSPIVPDAHVCSDYVARHLELVLPAPHTAHSLRHRFATRAYRNTHNLRSVQILLGHASVATTQRYVAVDDDDLTAAVDEIAA